MSKMTKQSKLKTETKEEFNQHLSTLCNAVIQRNFATHTTSNPFLDPLFDSINCMTEKDAMRSIATDILHKLRTEEKAMTNDIRAYLRTADDTEKNFIRSLDIRTESRFASDDENETGNYELCLFNVSYFVFFF